MKRKNFPGRKMIRKINAEQMLKNDFNSAYSEDELTRIHHAQSQRSKKRK